MRRKMSKAGKEKARRKGMSKKRKRRMHMNGVNEKQEGNVKEKTKKKTRGEKGMRNELKGEKEVEGKGAGVGEMEKEEKDG